MEKNSMTTTSHNFGPLNAYSLSDLQVYSVYTRNWYALDTVEIHHTSLSTISETYATFTNPDTGQVESGLVIQSWNINPA